MQKLIQNERKVDCNEFPSIKRDYNHRCHRIVANKNIVESFQSVNLKPLPRVDKKAARSYECLLCGDVLSSPYGKPRLIHVDGGEKPPSLLRFFSRRGAHASVARGRGRARPVHLLRAGLFHDASCTPTRGSASRSWQCSC